MRMYFELNYQIVSEEVSFNTKKSLIYEDEGVKKYLEKY